MHVVSSIDVGFGGVKFGKKNKHNELLCQSFASICPTSFRGSQDTAPIDVVHSTIDGLTYDTMVYESRNTVPFGSSS